MCLFGTPAMADQIHGHYFESSSLTGQYVDNFVNHLREPCEGKDCTILYDVENKRFALWIPEGVYPFLPFTAKPFFFTNDQSL